MRTAVLQVLDPAAGATDFPVRLFAEDPARPDWKLQPMAQGSMPGDLAAPPGAQLDGAPLTAQGAVELVRTHADPAAVELQTIGTYLHGLIASGPVAGALRQLLAQSSGEQPEADPPRSGLRWVLDLRPAAVGELPWELLLGPDAPLPFFLDPGHSAVRAPLEAVTACEPIDAPLRALVVLADRFAAGGGDAELREIKAAFRAMRHEVDEEILVEPRRKEIIDRWNAHRPHLFHFIGHGRESVTTRQPCLVLKGEEWSCGDIVTDLAEWRGSILAVLNACRSAQPGPAWTVAQSFLRLGAAAVIGMQADMPADAACAFSAGLYRKIAEGLPLDRAITAGRREVAKLETGNHKRHWALPRAELRRGLADGLKLPTGRREPWMSDVPQFARLNGFIDRKPERRKLFPRSGAASSPLVIVTGESSVGKSTLLCYFLEGCAVRGYRSRYVDLGRDRQYDVIELLRRIRSGDPNKNSRICDSVAADPDLAFRRLNHFFNVALVGGDVRSQPRGEAKVADLGHAFDPSLRISEDLIEGAFQRFQEGLMEAAKEQPLVIALDHLSGVTPRPHWGYFREHLLRPLLDRQLGPVRLIAAATDDELRLYGLDELERRGAARLQLELFDRTEFLTWAREFCEALAPNADAFEDGLKFAALWDKRVAGPWSPRFLRERIEPFLRTGEGRS